jgi:sensor domain CHASE-containing protein
MLAMPLLALSAAVVAVVESVLAWQRHRSALTGASAAA